MILTSSRLIARPWGPNSHGKDWVNNERAWILVNNGGGKVAICSVYMAAEVISNNDYRTWNDNIYECIHGEVQILKNDGYHILIIGDMNGHVGTPAHWYRR